jgi:hypothetical protein
VSASELSFEKHIKTLFRESDHAAMSKSFDLWSVSDATEDGGAIAARLRDGSMPCDAPWPSERVAIFTLWLEAGAKA